MGTSSSKKTKADNDQGNRGECQNHFGVTKADNGNKNSSVSWNNLTRENFPQRQNEKEAREKDFFSKEK